MRKIVELACMRIAKKGGKRASDLSSNVTLKFKRIGSDLLIETDDHIYRLGFLTIFESLFKLMLGE